MTIIAALWIGLLVDQWADSTLFSISTSGGFRLLLARIVEHLQRSGRS